MVFNFLLLFLGIEQGKGSGKREFSSGGNIETARFQRAKRVKFPVGLNIKTRLIQALFFVPQGT